MENQQKVFAEFKIRNTDRTTGTILSNEISKIINQQACPKTQSILNFIGTAGQSFAAFNTKGVTLELEGDANDYFWKRIIRREIDCVSFTRCRLCPEEKYYYRQRCFFMRHFRRSIIRGKAGERFGVRNSGVTASCRKVLVITVVNI